MSRPLAARLPRLLAAAAALAACHGADSLDPAVTAAAATYTLTTLTGDYVPTMGTTGTIVLRNDGTVAYQMKYGPAGTPPTAYQVVATGTFTVRGDSVALSLVADPAHPASVWQPIGVLRGTTLTLSYSGPADGPIVAVYQRR